MELNSDIDRVLLISPPWYRFFGAEEFHSPLGLCYIGGALEKNGFDVKVYNADFNSGGNFQSDVRTTEKYNMYLHSLKDIDHDIWKEIKIVINKNTPDIVGISVPTAKYGSSLIISRLVKNSNPEIPVVWGGMHPTILPDETIKNKDVDIVVRGEGEYTFLDIVNNIENLENVSGITYKKDDNIFHNSPRPIIENLDEIPYPARHLIIDKEKYPSEAFGNIFTSRGCPYNCIYCASRLVWTKRVRYRSAQNVIGEIKQIKKTFKTQHFRFEDDSFTLNKKLSSEVCRLLTQEKINIQWWCETRANLVTDELIKNMKKAGCDEVTIGVESGDEQTLKNIKKEITIDEIKNAATILRKNNMRLSTFFMIGFPWETKIEIDKTVSLMKELDPHQAIFSVATPYPGTELYDMCKSGGIIPGKRDWSTFFHQSPDMYLNKNIKREDFDKIVRETELLFERHNNRKQRELLMSDPLYVAKRIIKGGYYKPNILCALVRRYLLRR